MSTIRDIFNMIWSVAQTMTFMDIIDILLMSYFVYLLIKLIKETRANQLIKGIIIICVAYFLSTLIGLKSISYIVKSLLNVGILAILIMFQPEIRRALEKAGRTKLGGNIFNLTGSSDELTTAWNNAIREICDSCIELSSSKTGALIVIERKTKLGEQIENGTIVNATPSKELFGNIFFPNTPLHDGAVIIRDGIILAAACFLPKPQKEETIKKGYGSRHRAAVGMSEVSDAVIIVVSEETGRISIAENGVIDSDKITTYNNDGTLNKDSTRFKLNEYLHDAIFPKPKESKIPIASKLRNRSKGDDKN